MTSLQFALYKGHACFQCVFFFSFRKLIYMIYAQTSSCNESIKREGKPPEGHTQRKYISNKDDNIFQMRSMSITILSTSSR